MKKILLFFLAIFLAAANSFPYYDEVKAADPKKDQIVIHVKSKEEAKPVAKASVVLDFECEKETAPLEGMTDENGIFKAAIPEETYGISVKVAGPGFASKRIVLSHKDEKAVTGADINIELDRGEAIGGVLSMEDGQPISKVKILLYSQATDQKEYDIGDFVAVDCSSGKYELTTDENGSWNCIIPLGNDRLSFIFDHPRIGMSVKREICLGEDEETTRNLKGKIFKFSFSKPKQIKLKIVDDTGNPGEDAIAFISLNSHTDAIRLSSDKNGEAIASYQPSDCKGSLKVLVVKKGYATFEGEISNTMEHKDIKLEKAVPIKGKVVDVEGKPIRGVCFLRTYIFLMGNYEYPRIYSDIEGNFVLEDVLPSSPVKYHIIPFEKHMDAEILTSELLSKPTVVLFPEIHIKAIVRDKAGNPLKNIRCFEYMNDEMHMCYDEIVDGKFEKRINKSIEGNTGQLNYGLEVICRPYRKQFQERIIKPGDKEVNFTFIMDDKEVRKGTILGVDGKSAGNVKIFFNGEKRMCPLDEQLNYKVEEKGVFSSNELRHIVSDASGSYLFYPSTPKKGQADDDFNNGIYEFYPCKYNNGRTVLVTAFTNDGCLCMPVGEFDKAEKVQLQKYSKVEGDVLRGDELLTDRTVCLESIFIFGGEYFSVVLEDVKTNEKGHFVFEKVPPGYFVVNCHEEKQSVYGETAPGVSYKVKLGGYGVRITGKFIPPAGIQVDFKGEKNSLNIHAEDNGKFNLISEEVIPRLINSKYRQEVLVEILPDGTFNAVDVPPGRYSILFTAQKDGEIYAWTNDEFTIPEEAIKKGAVDLGLFDLK
ncbi:MAG TPA: hypothetical protein DCZ94_17275 [Lentisphaeria bacterium]|nr:MAG: hypothetical protein A2X48_20905 [Lentisphaerae bacterium GWF2_49_21]HBC88697.1 hypothetical protein [Lentisphaeria bacterium]